MDKYVVTGMNCAACSARVEKAVSAVSAVIDCSVSLLTNTMGVQGTASPEAILATVRPAGYGVSCRRAFLASLRMGAQPRVRGGGHEPFQFLRCH
ncbi:MAG: cation transporter [Desulfovibrio sp.]|nr:cation transporter [Desulfovibrio sp.]